MIRVQGSRRISKGIGSQWLPPAPTRATTVRLGSPTQSIEATMLIRDEPGYVAQGDAAPAASVAFVTWVGGWGGGGGEWGLARRGHRALACERPAAWQPRGTLQPSLFALGSLIKQPTKNRVPLLSYGYWATEADGHGEAVGTPHAPRPGVDGIPAREGKRDDAGSLVT